MSNVGRNIRFLRKQMGLTLEELSERADLDVGNLSRLERGLGGYSKEGISRICEALRVSEGTLFSDHLIEEQSIPPRAIPVLSGSEIIKWNPREPKVPSDPKNTVFAHHQTSSGAFAIRMDGDEMAPLFAPGDDVIIDPAAPAKPGDYVLAVVDGDLTVFRQYRLASIGTDGTPVIELVPLNDVFPRVSSREHQIALLGSMVVHLRYPPRRTSL